MEGTAACRKYLFQFAHEHLDFRIPELAAVCKLFGTKLAIPDSYNHKSPYLVVELPSEDVLKKIASRTVLIKSCYELWAQGPNYDVLFQNLRSLSHAFMAPYLSPNCTYRIKHDSFNKNIGLPAKIQLFENVITKSGIEFQGKLDLESADHSFHLFEFYERYNKQQAADDPEVVYFGRWVLDGHRSATITNHDLRNRKVIGNTSMDPALALIMANMGHVTSGKLVFDPFVGTGSLLVASAHCGGYVMGTELDWKILHGRGRSSRHDKKWRSLDETIQNNLSQYGLDHLYLDVMVADASRHAMWRGQGMMDAIITDPPYGIREPTLKVGPAKEENSTSNVHKDFNAPNKVQYGLEQIMLDLINFAAKFLRMGGYLVYWVPIYREEYVESHIPSHPCLKLVANCEQVLKPTVSRRLITMEKVIEYKDEHCLAELADSHYKDGSFREKYFRPREKNEGDDIRKKPYRRKKKKVLEGSRLACDSESSETASPVPIDQSHDMTSLTHCQDDQSNDHCQSSDKPLGWSDQLTNRGGQSKELHHSGSAQSADDTTTKEPS